jgi:hypothetical protein
MHRIVNLPPHPRKSPVARARTLHLTSGVCPGSPHQYAAITARYLSVPGARLQIAGSRSVHILLLGRSF